jgi:CHASE2 domain-containing sensor protein
VPFPPLNFARAKAFCWVFFILLFASWACLLPPPLNALPMLSYDFYYLFQKTHVPQEALLVYMDDASADELKQDVFWRWDRRLHARLVDQLSKYHARAIVFDTLFDQETTSDAAFADAMRRAGHVALVAKFTPQIVNGDLITTKLTPPTQRFQTVAAWGLVEDAGENERMIRAHNPGAFDVPSVAWRTAELTGVSLPLNRAQKRWIRYYGPAGAIPGRTYAEILRGRVDPNVISNKVIFVGAHVGVGYVGGKGTDDFKTPYSRWTNTLAPGLEVYATVFLNLVHQDWLRRPGPFAEITVLLLTSALLAICFVRLPLRTAIIAASIGALVFVVVTVAVWSQLHVWYSWLIPVAVQLPIAFLCGLVSRLSTATEQNRKMEMMLGLAGAQQPQGTTVVARSNEPFQEKAPVGDHELLRLVGRGAYGEVWLARDVIGSLHALKIVHRRTFSDSAPYDREFKGMQKFTPISHLHPNLVRILHVGRNDVEGYFFYVMERADALNKTESLEKYRPHTLGAELEQRGRLPVGDCVKIGLRLTSALAYLHSQGLLHRDIKPANIIFIGGEPKLADIGLVTTASSDGDPSLVGTEGYFPSKGLGAPSADTYSLGKVLYELYTGLSRHKFPSLPEDLDNFTDSLIELNQIVIRACESEPGDRYLSAMDMHHDLSALARKIGV